MKTSPSLRLCLRCPSRFAITGVAHSLVPKMLVLKMLVCPLLVCLVLTSSNALAQSQTQSQLTSRFSTRPAVANPRPNQQPAQQSDFNRLPFRKTSFQKTETSPLTTPAARRRPLQANLVAFESPATNPTTPNPTTTAYTQDEAGNKDDQIRPLASEVKVQAPAVAFIDDIHLPATEGGVVQSLNVKEGDFVPAGQIIGKIDDEMFQLALERTREQHNIALITANDNISIQAAEMEYKLKKLEAKSAIELGKSGSKPKSEVRIAIFEEEIARLKIIKSKMEKEKAIGEAKLAEAQMKEVEAKLQRHHLKADFDAYVIEIFKRQQEYVNPGEDVVRIARMDRLWVQGIVNNSDLNPYEALNRPVTVRVELARGEVATFQGKIVNVALERQTPDSFMVKAEIQNRPIQGHWTLQPFSEVEMIIHLNQGNSSTDDPSRSTAAAGK